MQFLTVLGIVTIFTVAGVEYGKASQSNKNDNIMIQGHARASDGDSLVISNKRIRLEGIDAPELRQQCYLERMPYPCGETSQHTLSDIIKGKIVTCNITGTDRYKRYLAHCYVDGENINAAMVTLGQALAYDRYSKRYVLQEQDARVANIGMHRYKYTFPWDWRKKNRR